MNSPYRLLFCAVFAATTLASSPSSRAVIITFTDPAAFNAAAMALGMVQNEGFESLPTGTLPAGPNQLGLLMLNIGLVGGTTTTGASIGSASPISGLRELTLNADTAFRTYDMSAGLPILAFGFDFAGAATGGIASLRADGQLFTFGSNGGGSGFFGIISTTPLTSVAFEDAAPGLPTEIFDLDNVRFVTVPEPSTFALLGIAALGSWVLRRRTKDRALDTRH